MLKEEWAAIQRDAAEMFNSPMIEEFRRECERHFEGALEGKGPFRRRPNTSLRLICDSPVPTKVVASPYGTARHGEFVPHADKIHCELFQERNETVDGTEASRFTRRLTFALKPECARLGSI